MYYVLILLPFPGCTVPLRELGWKDAQCNAGLDIQEGFPAGGEVAHDEGDLFPRSVPHQHEPLDDPLYVKVPPLMSVADIPLSFKSNNILYFLTRAKGRTL